MNDTAPEHDVTTGTDRSPMPRRSGVWRMLVLLAAIAAVALWFTLETRRQHQRDADDTLRLQALESRVESLRRDSRSHGERLQQADATNRVVREELLGMGQRAALLEQQVAKLADADRRGAQALRLDEAELLLTLGQQRLQLAADLDGARRAYALAGGVLDGIDNPGLLNLRQALAQERAALDALPADPRRAALDRLDRFAASLPAESLASALPPAERDAPWWDRVLSRLVQVRRVDSDVAISGEDRNGARVALELELSMARIAIERRDAAGYRIALGRAAAWLPRLWPGASAQQQELDRLRALPLSLDIPTLGSTLQLLRAQRGGAAG